MIGNNDSLGTCVPEIVTEIQCSCCSKRSEQKPKLFVNDKLFEISENFQFFDKFPPLVPFQRRSPICCIIIVLDFG